MKLTDRDKTSDLILNICQEITCSVSAWPPVVEVEWSHEGEALTELSPGVVISSQGEQFSLTIPEVNTSSVGEYTCTATNR